MPEIPSPRVACSRTDTRPYVTGDEHIRLSPMPVWSRTYATGSGGCYVNSNAVFAHNAHTHIAYAHIAHAYNAIAARMTHAQQSKIATKFPFESLERYPSLKREQKTLHNYTRSKNFT